MVARYAASASGVADRDDIESAAVVGLVEAVRSWDPAAGVPFRPFAAARVRGAVLDEFRALDHLSRWHREEVRAGRAEAERPLSLEVSVAAGVEFPAVDAVDPAAAVEAAEAAHAVGVAVARLPVRERTVVRGRWNFGRSTADLADQLGVDPTRVTQIHGVALVRLRRVLTDGGVAG